MYYIYRIPQYVHKNGSIGKIGVSVEPKVRVKAQGYSDYEILEEHTCIYEVSKREHELQREWGYPVDFAPYWMSYERWGVNASTPESRIKGGQTTGKWAVESGHLATARLASVASPKHTSKQKRKCQYCGKLSNPGSMYTHEKACKHKKGNLLLDSL